MRFSSVAVLAAAMAVLAPLAPAAHAQAPAAAPSAAATPAPAPDASAAAPAPAPAVSPGHRLAGALLNAGAMGTLMDQFEKMLPRMFEEKMGDDPDMRRLPPATQAKVRAYMSQELPGQMRALLQDAAVEAAGLAGPRLMQRYNPEDLTNLAAFFESPDGVSILKKLFLQAGQSLDPGARRPSTAEILGALSGDEIKALAIFISSPGGELFQRDSDGMFRIIGNAFSEAVDARRGQMERMVVDGLCGKLTAQEVRQLGGGSRCPAPAPT